MAHYDPRHPRNGQTVDRATAEAADAAGQPSYRHGQAEHDSHNRPGAQAQQQLREGRYDSLGRLLIRALTGR